MTEYLPIPSISAAKVMLEGMEERLKEAALAQVPECKVVGVPDVTAEFGLSMDSFTGEHLAVELVHLGALVKAT